MGTGDEQPWAPCGELPSHGESTGRTGNRGDDCQVFRADFHWPWGTTICGRDEVSESHGARYAGW